MLATGVLAWIAGPTSEVPWLRLHTLSFLVWFAVMTVHVLGHLGRTGDESLRDLAESRHGDRQARRRGWLVGGAILAGVVIAAVGIQLPTGWTSAFGN